MSASLFSQASAQDQNQAINDYVGQVLSGDYTDQQRAQMISSQAAQMGVSPQQIAQATGYDINTVNAYLSQPTQAQITAAEQAARQAHMDMGMPGRTQGVDPSVYQTLYRTNAQGQVVRNSDGLAAPFSLNDIKNPNAVEYFKQNPQELFALGALGGAGGQGYFRDAGVRGTSLKMGQLTPDQWYRGYTSDFEDGWDQDTSNTYRWAGQDAQGKAAAGGMVPGAGAQTPSQTAATAGATGAAGTDGATGTSGAAGTYGGASQYGADLSMTQQSLLKALMDQQERDSITGEMRDNASELYDRAQGYEQGQLNDIALYTGGNSGVYNRYGRDIENDVGNAVADARVGQTQALNTAARQAARYGVAMPTALGGVSSTQASQLAGAANTTRNNAVDKYRSLVGQGIGLKDSTFKTSQAATADSMGRAEASSMAGRNMRIQDDSLDWAKQLDVTGMARGMPGASQGAYGVAVGAGNSAVQNQMAPGQALIGAMGQANNTTMQGQQTAMQGTLGVLNAQSNYANTLANSGGLGDAGTLLGAGVKAYTAFSDRRLKENIEAVGKDFATGLNIYRFEYIGGTGQRYEGVMADEVEAVMPAAVFEMPDGFKAVNYQMLGIEMKEVA
jgi:hypothetical protein